MLKNTTKITEEVFFNGEMVASTNKDDTQIIGEVIISSYSGKVLFSRTIHKNDLLIGGSVYFLEKTYGKRAAFAPIPLDVELGVNTEVIADSTTLRNEEIIGIVCGIGGSGDIYNTIKPINRHKRTVETIVPYRQNELDHFDDTRSEYFLRTYDPSTGLFSFYGKKFKTTPEIKVEYVNGIPVPNDVGDLTTAQRINVYSESTLTVSSRDFREYFMNQYGSTALSRINSIGLVAGYPIVNSNGDVEYANVRTISALNMENKELKNAEDFINITYKHYVI